MARQQEVRSALVQLLGPTPLHEPGPRWQDVEVVESTDDEVAGVPFTHQRFLFRDGFGLPVTGRVLVPKHTPGGKRPAILYQHFHGGWFELGSEELVRCWNWGQKLLARGYVVMATDVLGHGERLDPRYTENGRTAEETLDHILSMYGLSRLHVRIHDDLLTLELLRTHPQVDPDRIGTAGMSMGSARVGWLRVFAGDQLAASAALGTIMRNQDSIRTGRVLNNRNNHFLPGQLRAGVDTEAVWAAGLGSPLRLIIGPHDLGSPGWEFVMEYLGWASKRLELDTFLPVVMDYPDDVDHDTSHNWHPREQEKTLDWFDRHLLR